MFAIKTLPSFSGCVTNLAYQRRSISTTPALSTIRLLTRLRVVDNSTIGKQAMLAGKPPYVIHVYRKGKAKRDSTAGRLGDKVSVAVQGQLKKAYIVGWHMHETKITQGVPRMDTNNCVLVDDAGNPLGTRILVPIPAVLRSKPELAKILAIASKLV